jgi:hypothetical protein
VRLFFTLFFCVFIDARVKPEKELNQGENKKTLQ